MDDADDIQQSLLLDVLRELHRFDPAKASRATFCNMVINCRVKNIRLKRKAKKHDPDRNEYSLDDLVPSADGGMVLRSTTHPHGEGVDRRYCVARRPPGEGSQMETDVGEVVASLPPRYRVAAEKLSESSPAQVARSMGLSAYMFRATYMIPIMRRFAAAGLEKYI